MCMGIIQKIKDFMEASRRVLVLAKKPDWKEFSTMAKVTAIGIVIIGVIGFIVIFFFTFTAIGS